MTRKTGSPLLAASAARQRRSVSGPHPHLPFLKALSHRCHQCSAPNPGSTALDRGQRIRRFFFYCFFFSFATTMFWSLGTSWELSFSLELIAGRGSISWVNPEKLQETFSTSPDPRQETSAVNSEAVPPLGSGVPLPLFPLLPGQLAGWKPNSPGQEQVGSVRFPSPQTP